METERRVVVARGWWGLGRMGSYWLIGAELFESRWQGSRMDACIAV